MFMNTITGEYYGKETPQRDCLFESGTTIGTILCPFPKTYKYNPHIFISPTLIFLNKAQKYSIIINLNLL